MLPSPKKFFLENIKKFYPGIVIYKSLTGSDLSTIRIIKNSNHKIICIDEEGIFTMGRRVQI